jgi:hypothetical protein
MQGKVSFQEDAMPVVYAGVDVSKEWLDVHLHPLGEAGGLAMIRPASAS